MTLFCSPNFPPKSPSFFCVRLFAAFSFSIQLLVHSFLILLEQSVYSILFNSLIIPLILVASACILCFSSSRTTFKPFFLTLYLCSTTLYFSLFSVSPRFFHSKMLICFRNSCIDCCILLFHHGFPRLNHHYRDCHYFGHFCLHSHSSCEEPSRKVPAPFTPLFLIISELISLI